MSDQREDNRRPNLMSRPVPRESVDQWPWGGSKSPSVGNDDEDDHNKDDHDENAHQDDDHDQEGDGLEEDDEPIFLRKDIPSMIDAPQVHEELMQLWQSRQQASQHLVKALDNDDPKLFERLEAAMRQLNHAMHLVLKSYRDAGSSLDLDKKKYVDTACQLHRLDATLKDHSMRKIRQLRLCSIMITIRLSGG